MNVNGHELAIEIDGPDDAPVALLVHGLGGTSNFYQVQADALAQRLRVIRVDSAGAGRSPVTDDISITPGTPTTWPPCWTPCRSTRRAWSGIP